MMTHNKINLLKRLGDMRFEYKRRNSPSVPVYAIPAKKYVDSCSNTLTAAVMDFLKMKGFFIARVNTQGNYSQRLGKFIYSGSTKGQSDLNAIVNGRSWQIEIKFGKDKLNEYQERVRDQVIAAGGVFLVVKTFPGFISDYLALTNESDEQLFALPSKALNRFDSTKESQKHPNYHDAAGTSLFQDSNQLNEQSINH